MVPGHGDAFNRAALEEMPVGTYRMVPKTMAHFGWSRGETIIQVHGIGPFKQFFVDQITRITETGAERYFKYKSATECRRRRDRESLPTVIEPQSLSSIN
jgi:hypothetical protein